MATLESSAAQILDKLSDCIVGPVRGFVTTTATPDTDVEQGQLATLPDGRRVRCVKTTTVTAAGTQVPVRLEFLSPAYPAASNFVAVAAGTVATWIAPPADLAATGTTSTFGMGVQASALRVGSVVEYDQLETPADEFAAGTNGTARMILLEPDITRAGEESYGQRCFGKCTWVLRVNFGDLGLRKDQRGLARRVFEKLDASLLGATVGDDFVRFESWKRVKGGLYSWELTFTTMLVTVGRINSYPQTDLPEFTSADVGITLPGDADQPTPFRVLETFTFPIP